MGITTWAAATAVRNGTINIVCSFIRLLRGELLSRIRTRGFLGRVAHVSRHFSSCPEGLSGAEGAPRAGDQRETAPRPMRSGADPSVDLIRVRSGTRIVPAGQADFRTGPTGTRLQISSTVAIKSLRSGSFVIFICSSR